MTRSIYLLIILLSLTGGYIFANDFVTLQITSGYNSDVIASGIGKADATTSTTFDTGTYVLVAQGWQEDNSATPLTWGLPTNREITNNTFVPGLKFQLGQYDANNSLKLQGATETGELRFNAISNLKSIYLLVAGTDQLTQEMEVSITFVRRDAYTHTETVTIHSWSELNAAQFAINNIGRLERATNTADENALSKLYQVRIMIPEQYQSVSITGIKFAYKSTNTGVINVLAATAEQLSCPAPTGFSAEEMTPQSQTVSWLNTDGDLIQYKYGVSGFDFSTEGTNGSLSASSTTLSGLTLSSLYEIYARRVCGAGGDTSAWVLNYFVTNCDQQPQVLTTVEDSVCGSGGISLKATVSAGDTKWYEKEVGDISTGKGSTISMNMTFSKDYYVEASVETTVLSDSIEYSGTATGTRTIFTNGIYFTPKMNMNLKAYTVHLAQNVTNATVTVYIKEGDFTGNTNNVNAYHSIGGVVLVTGNAGQSVRIDFPNGGIELKKNTPYTLVITDIPVTTTNHSTNVENDFIKIEKGFSGSQNFGSANNTIIENSQYRGTLQYDLLTTCKSPRKLVKAIVVPIPEVSLGNDTSICPGVVMKLGVDNQMSDYTYKYEWSTNETTPSIDIVQPGTYSVKVTINDFCEGQDEINFRWGAVPLNILPPVENLCIGDSLELNAGNNGYKYLWSNGATTQRTKVYTGGVYSVKITSPDNCDLNSSIQIVNRDLPVVDLGEDIIKCANNDTVTLDAGIHNEIYAKSWSTGENTQSIRVTDSGTYVLKVITPFACISEDALHIGFVPAPSSKGFSFVPLFFEDLGKVTFSILDTNRVNACSWDFGDGNTSTEFEPTHTYASYGNFNVVLTLFNECEETSYSQMIAVDPSQGTNIDKLSNVDLKIYPNPTTGAFNVVAAQLIQEIQVVDITGRLVHRVTAHAHQVSLNASDWADATYILHVKTDAGMFKHKLTKKQ